MNKKLLELANSVESNFSFDEFRFDRYTGTLKCGTVGCILGHFALVSEDWEMSNNTPKLVGSGTITTPITNAAKYFNIPYEIACILFIPENIHFYDAGLYKELGLEITSANADLEVVIENVRKIAKYTREELDTIFDDLVLAD